MRFSMKTLKKILPLYIALVAFATTGSPLYGVQVFFNMKLITLTGKSGIGKFGMVDDNDFEKLNKYKWHHWYPHRIKGINQEYAIRNLRLDEPGYIFGKRNKIKMHRFILNVSDRKTFVDHKDHNGLNCQKHNLRIATISQNATNTTGWGKSAYLGVSLKRDKKRKDGSYSDPKWRATMKINGKYRHLGTFKTEEEAAMAYDAAAKIHHKEFANLNFKAE